MLKKQQRQQCSYLVNIFSCLITNLKFIVIVRLFFLHSVYTSESESDNEFIEPDDSIGDLEFDSPAPRERRNIQKQNWITPRLCSALDKAKVKKKRLQK